MGAATGDRPKCLVELAGRTLLDRQVSALALAGVREVAVVTGWCSWQFERVPLTRFHNAAWAESSMVDSLACAREWLEAGPVVVAYGDIVFTPAAVTAVASAPGPLVVGYDPDWLTQWSRRFGDPLIDAETFAVTGGRLTDIGGTPSTVEDVTGQYLGLLKLEPAGWAELAAELSRSDTRRDTTGLLRRLIARDFAVRAVPVPGPWHEFDSARDCVVGEPVLRELDEVLSGAEVAS
ncbi:NTP transferase domain-containing protein [Amycolatopsis tucumanensis]|uniref:phosphocholine cytidylyltransferase family protein n=1 Tax=Amycolatopsis tucumanensis TaxID=401106 RepID=UPI003D713940